MFSKGFFPRGAKRYNCVGMVLMMISFFGRVENMLGKGEQTGY